MCSLESSNGLEKHRCPLPSADTRGSNTIPDATLLHRPRHRQRESRARCRERMPERDGTAIDVYFFMIESEQPLACNDLRRNRFVDFEEANIADAEPRQFQYQLDRRYRTDTHILRIDAARGRRKN